MAKCSLILLGILALTCVSATNGQLIKMSQQGTNDILGKLQPQIGFLSQLMASSAKQSTKETEQLITDHITKDLGLILEKLETLTNRTQDDTLCCKCNRCERYFRVCGKICCAQGYKGCACYFCSSNTVQNVSQVGDGMTAPISSWLESAKNQLQASLADLMDNINVGKTKCCTCVICKRKRTACFIPFCCAKGGKLCKCITCSSGKGELIASMDDDDDSTTLTEGMQPTGDHINSLIDSLLVLFNSP